MKRIFTFLFVAFGAAVAFGTLSVIRIARSIPPPELLERRQVPETTKIYDRTGEVLLYELHGDEKRAVVPFPEIPQALKHAVLATEDAGFYAHPAFDWRAILRAFFVNLKSADFSQGGSTITQQLAKNAFLSPERTLARKIRELILAMRLEERYAKDEIFAFYLNQIPFGSNVYGVEAASQTYFAKSVRALALPEVAVLAAMIQAPSYYSPWGSRVPELAARRDLVLDRMAGAGFLTRAEADAAKQAAPAFARPQPLGNIRAPHFVMAVQEYLETRYGADFMRSGGLTVTTTLDWNIQELAEKTVREGAERNEKLYAGANAALVAEDPKTGQILAMVGSRDGYATSSLPAGCTPGATCTFEPNFNVALQGLRQPGSALKPFVYATLFEKGYSPDTVLFDAETEFDTTGNPAKSYRPHNYDGRFRGPVRLRDALAQSLNIPAVKVLYLAGLDAVIRNVQKFGLKTLTEKHRYGLSLVLGGGEVTLADLVGAYATFAEDGMRRPQSFILRVEGKEGKAFEEYRDRPERVIDAQYARLINDILSDIEGRSRLFAAYSLNLTIFPNHEVALKTGTTDDFRDAWVVGYTPSVVVGVWAGNNDNKPMERRGGSVLAVVPIWSAFMAKLLENLPPQTFAKPEPVTPLKPVMAGEHVVRYQSEDKILPQVHNILFYVDKKNPSGPEPERPEADPQFKNWEEPVIAWARANIPDFASYNEPLPPGSAALFAGAPSAPRAADIIIRSPENGAFVRDRIAVEADISAAADIEKIELYFHNNLMETSAAAAGTTTVAFRAEIAAPRLELQNTIKIVAVDVKRRTLTKEVIVFR